MKKILIVGATSAIAEAAARVWAERGDMLFLVGRRGERLQAIADDLRVRGSPRVATQVMDANALDEHAPMLAAAETALGGLDVVLLAHGTLSDQAACQQSVPQLVQELTTNAISFAALLTHLANRLEAQRSGTIVVISSVAGDRGRQSNYVYGSAKALLTAFASGLRQRLHKAGVAVLTIKPGFVDTPMTKDFRKGLLWASAERVARRIVGAVDAGAAREIYAPGFWRWVMLIIRLLPTALFRRLRL